MYTLDAIRHITFTQCGRNKYSADEVDDFVDGCADTVERLLKEKRALEQEKAEMAGKMEVLANKLVEYRKGEESISDALLSAQQTGKTIVREANQKAELILNDARIKAENMEEAAKREIVNEENQLREIKQAVSDFKASLLELYREHLRQIDLLPEEEKPEEPEAPVEEPVAEEQPAQEEAPAESEPAEAAEEPAAEEPAEEQPEQEEAVPAEAPAAEEAPVQSEMPGFRFPDLQFGEEYESNEKRGLFRRKNG